MRITGVHSISLDRSGGGIAPVPLFFNRGCPLEPPCTPANWSVSHDVDFASLPGGNYSFTAYARDISPDPGPRVAWNVSYWPTSWTYGSSAGSDDHTINTTAEIDNVRATLGESGYLDESSTSTVWNGIQPESRSIIYPTSWSYGNDGGVIHSVDTEYEARRVTAALNATTTTADYAAVWWSLSPADQAWLDIIGITASSAAEDSIPLPLPMGLNVPQPGLYEWDGTVTPLAPDRQAELAALDDPNSVTAGLTDNVIHAHAAGDDHPNESYPPNGKHDPDILFLCAGLWAPIQARSSGFVIGNCRGGTKVAGYKADVKPPGHYPGAHSEGRGWEAVSLPASEHFLDCAWMNIQNRLHESPTPIPSEVKNRCDAGPVSERRPPANHDMSDYMKRYSGPVHGSVDPNTNAYKGYYIWRAKEQNSGKETDGLEYIPNIYNDEDHTDYCQAYANINPSYRGQQVRPDEKTFAVHSGSRYLRIRYMARYQAKDEAGHLRWWVMARSKYPTDSSEGWGFISADCLFKRPGTLG